MAPLILECVVNVSEGRDNVAIDAIAGAGGHWLLDVHRDADHHRSVLTLGGPAEAVEDSARRVVHEAVRRIDLGQHHGVHPRMGAADVVPFVALPGWGASPNDAVMSRDRLARWMGEQEEVPCFFYGPERSLPDVRRGAFTRFAPDTGPGLPHPTAGASALGARGVLIAYNIWLAARQSPEGGPDGTADDAAGATTGKSPGVSIPAIVSVAHRIADEIRCPALRTLGFEVHGGAQVSCNLVDPEALRPDEVFDAVAVRAESAGYEVARAELVGLAPSAVIRAIPDHRWPELDLGPERTIEARLESRGIRPD